VVYGKRTVIWQEVKMNRLLAICIILMGIGMYGGVYLQPLLNSILSLMLVMAGLYYIFHRRFSRQLWRNFLILLIGPIFVCCLIGLVLGNGSRILGGFSEIDPIWVIVVVVLLMLSAFTYIFWQHHRQRQVDRYHLQGAEREPVLPEPRQDFDDGLNTTEDNNDDIPF